LLICAEGVLVECDPSIKAILTRIDDQHGHAFIIDDIDDEHVLVKTHKHEELKQLLKDVSLSL
jgi:TFIIH basal transcription factor complex TTD-A subunit